MGIPAPESGGPPPKKGRRTLWIAVIVVVIVVSVAVVYELGLFAPSIDVSSVTFESSDHACLDRPMIDHSGFTAHGGASVGYSFELTNPNTTATCSVQAVSTSTSGFGVSGANTPLEIPASGSAVLSFTINIPDHAYIGNVTVLLA